MGEGTRRRAGSEGRPLRVVVLGSSTTFMVVPTGGTPDEECYPALLDELLFDHGLVARTVLSARWHATAKELLRQYEMLVQGWLPDVLILNVGFVDAQARVAPTWLYRHVVTWQPGVSAVAATYRRNVAPRLRRQVLALQRRTSPMAPLSCSRLAPGPFERTVTQLVRNAVRQHQALVLVQDIDTPGANLLRWQPGLDQRVSHYNQILSRVVRDAPGRRALLVRTSEVVARDPATLLPDGIHRSAEGHRRVAELLVDTIASNLALLSPGGPSGRPTRDGAEPRPHVGRGGG